MTQLTKNIWRYELACSDGCGFASMDFETVNVVQETCDHFAEELGVDKVALHINSAARCFKYNRKPKSQGGPGSNDESQHPRANALDFSIDGVSSNDIYDYLDERYPDLYGIGRYNTFTHLDTRTGRARW